MVDPKVQSGFLSDFPLTCLFWFSFEVLRQLVGLKLSELSLEEIYQAWLRSVKQGTGAEKDLIRPLHLLSFCKRSFGAGMPAEACTMRYPRPVAFKAKELCERVALWLHETKKLAAGQKAASQSARWLVLLNNLNQNNQSQ